MSAVAKQQKAPVERSSAGLRDAIFDEIDALRGGASNPTRANAIAKLATGIVDSVRMEMEVQKHLRSIADQPQVLNEQKDLGSPLALGSPQDK